ncbi:MAG: nucleotidyltransferase domain-containing protein [Clostridiales bacterium]|nr:nucleotidyltransferase domain-containing protein [Clostridiales bacterium]
MNRQQELITFLIEELKTYNGVKSLFLKGSLANDTGDEYSDVDFYILVDEAHYDELLDRRETVVKKFKPIVYQSHVNFGQPQVIVIYDNNLHLDLYVIKDIPLNGLDSIEVLYDPDDLLINYRKEVRKDDNKLIIEHLSDVIYTFHELDIAIKRKDDLWAMRLVSHMMADLSLVLCTMYELEKPVLHMKGIYHKLPKELKVKVDEILESMTPKHLMSCIDKVILLTDEIISSRPNEVKERLDTTYFNFVKTEVF